MGETQVFYDIVKKKYDEYEETDVYEDGDMYEARSDYINLVNNQEVREYEYVILRRITIDPDGKESIEIIDDYWDQ